MNKRLKAISRTCTALACAAAVLCSTSTKAYADDSVEALEQQTSGLSEQLNALNQELNGLSSEITGLATKIEETDAAVNKAELDLAAAKLDEQLQYDAMKKRIKYMYEAGNNSLLHMIFSSRSMGEFLNRTEFVRNVTEYDRNMLDELQKIHDDIAEKEASLKKEQASLQTMKDTLDSRWSSLNDKVASTSGELQASSEALANAKAAQEAAQKALEEQAQAQLPSAPGAGGASDSGSGSTGGGTTTAPPVDAGTDDLVLFAAILQCEAGSSNYDGLLAVATVIMNRMASPSYPNTLSGVIYQSGQFSPTWNGSLNRVLANGPASLCYQVAQDALGGARLASVSNCYSFRASWTGFNGVHVGGNVFF